MHKLLYSCTPSSRPYVPTPCATAVHHTRTQDVEETLDAIQARHVDGARHAFKNVFVVGDQQMYDRVVNLKLLHPDRYSWVIPIAGEFHFFAHCVDAVHKLYWSPLVGWVVDKLEFSKIVKENEDNITHFKQYDRFYQLLTLAVVVVLHSTVPMDLLMNPMQLLAMCKDNAGGNTAVGVCACG